MQLSENHLMIRDLARQFAADHLIPNAAEWDESATVPVPVSYTHLTLPTKA